MTLPIVLTFAALLVATAFALLWSRWPAWSKGLLVVGVTAFYFFAFDAISGMWGWPAAESLPERFVLVAAVVEEPTKQTPGALYLWVNSLEGSRPAREPRAYRVPYEKDLHALVNEGLKKARQGVAQMGTASRASVPGASVGFAVETTCRTFVSATCPHRSCRRSDAPGVVVRRGVAALRLRQRRGTGVISAGARLGVDLSRDHGAREQHRHARVAHVAHARARDIGRAEDVSPAQRYGRGLLAARRRKWHLPRCKQKRPGGRTGARSRPPLRIEDAARGRNAVAGKQHRLSASAAVGFPA